MSENIVENTENNENIIENAGNNTEAETPKENKKSKKAKETKADSAKSDEVKAETSKGQYDDLKGRKTIIINSAKDIVFVCPEYHDSVLLTKTMTYAGNVRGKEPNVYELYLDDDGMRALELLVGKGYTISK